MTLNQIRAFVMVAQHGGFTAAARALNMSHTTLSSQIQMIEREYGAELFHRRGRRVELSTLGLEMLPMARRMISLESDMRQMLDGTGKLHYGTLKLGAVSPYHVTELIESFHAVYPRIKLSVKLGNSELVLDDLDKYVCDVGVVASCQPQRRYYMQPYARYPVIAFVRHDHPFAKRDAIALDELAGEPLLMREEGSTTRKALEDALHEHKIKVDIAMEIGSREALRESVARGLGVGRSPSPNTCQTRACGWYVSRMSRSGRKSMSAVCTSDVSRAWWPPSSRPLLNTKAPCPATASYVPSRLAAQYLKHARPY